MKNLKLTFLYSFLWVLLFTLFFTNPQVIHATCIPPGYDSPHYYSIATCSHGYDCASGSCDPSAGYRCFGQAECNSNSIQCMTTGTDCLNYSCAWYGSTCNIPTGCAAYPDSFTCQASGQCVWAGGSCLTPASGITDTFPPISDVNINCQTLITPTQCAAQSDFCSWNQGNLVGCNATQTVPVVYDNPVSPYQTCVSHDFVLAGITVFTAAAAFDIPCQLNNFLTFLFTDDYNNAGKLFQADYIKLFQTFPIGYITRLKSILLDPAIAEPPAITYTVGSSMASTGLTGTYTYNVFDHMDIIGTIKEDTGTQTRNIWDIFMPYWNTLVYVSLALTCLISVVPDVSNLLENNDENNGLDKHWRKKK